MSTTPTLMSFAEFERLDQGADHIELLDGELIRVPPAERVHMEISRRLFMLLNAAVESRRDQLNVGTVYFEMGYRLAENEPSWLQPDVSLSYPGQSGDRYFIGAPLIAFEIVSPGDSASELTDKVDAYLAHGSEEVWLIYAKQRFALVYERSEAVRKETRAIRTGLLPGIEIPLEQIL